MKHLTPQILALYLGCEVQTPHRHYPDPKGKSVHKCGTVMEIDLVINQAGIWFVGEEKENLVNFYIHEVKPILRSLYSITDEDREPIYDAIWPQGKWGVVWRGKIEFVGFLFGLGDSDGSDLYRELEQAMHREEWAAALNFLRSKGYDCDDLIDSGLAISKK